MGVINANDDSFFEGSRFQGKEALSAIEKMINDGAKIIDIGGVSSRPGSEYPGVDEELRRVKPIIDEIYDSRLYEKALFSIDTFVPEVLEYALDRGFKIANDITGLESDEYAKIAAKYNASVVIMHKKGDPKNMQKNPFYENVILEVDEFFKERIEKAKSFGVKDIILDVGIGFGKRLEDNLALIKHMEHFLHFGYELLIGASRKSMIDMIMKKEGLSTTPQERLPGTLILHAQAVGNGASIVRCHDVKEHFQALKVFEELREFDI
jgi:dihydropteroate synthase